MGRKVGFNNGQLGSRLIIRSMIHCRFLRQCHFLQLVSFALFFASTRALRLHKSAAFILEPSVTAEAKFAPRSEWKHCGVPGIYSYLPTVGLRIELVAAKCTARANCSGSVSSNTTTGTFRGPCCGICHWCSAHVSNASSILLGEYVRELNCRAANVLA